MDLRPVSWHGLLPGRPAAKSTHKKARRPAKVVRAKRGPSYQVHPTAGATRIQQALTEKGYFKGRFNGNGATIRVSAMKQFQADQKLPDDGKNQRPALIGSA